jgi:hypothetical protein
MMCLRISLFLALGALLLCGCDKPIFTKFIIQYKSPDLLRFYRTGVRTVVFPIVTKEVTPLNFNASAREIEGFLREHQDHIRIIPFDDFLEALSDSNALGNLVAVLNTYYRKHEVSVKEVSRLASHTGQLRPEYFLFLRLERMELYRDLKKEYKIQLTLSGKLYGLDRQAVVLSFVCTSFSRSPDKTRLPNLNEIVRLTLDEMAKGLPYDPQKVVGDQEQADW